MKPMKYSASRRHDSTRLLIAGEQSSAMTVAAFGDIDKFVNEKDLFIFNTSGTIPASFDGFFENDGSELEVRLATFAGAHPGDFSRWWAVLFGSGDWRMPTEERGAVRTPVIGERIIISGNGYRLTAKVTEVSAKNGRLIRIRFLEEDPAPALFALGRPIQYSYHREPLKLWDVQTPLAQAPLSVEPPSALFPFTWQRILALIRGHQAAFILHAAGLSSTGDSELDGDLPLSEYYSVPDETAAAIEATRARGGRVIAVGTTVARALESFWAGDRRGRSGYTSLKLGPHLKPKVVDGLITGFHEPGTSHYLLESAFLDQAVVKEAFERASEAGFVGHEYGDLFLIWKS